MPLFDFQAPDEVGSSEYRAVYECLHDGLDSHDPQDDELTREEFAANMLEEFIDQAFVMLKQIKRQPQLKVEYFGAGVEPNLAWPDGMMGLFDTVYIDGDAEGVHVLTYKDVSVYETRKDFDMTSDCWYATYPRCSWESEDAFDIRDLDEPPDDFKPKGVDHDNSDHMALAWAVEQGTITNDGLQ